MNQLRLEIEGAAVSAAKYDDAGGWTRTYTLAPEFSGFAGHFPQRPILPAIVQMLLGLATAEASVGCDVALSAIQNAKFVQPLGPDMPITVTCQPVGDWATAKIRLTTEHGLAASFSLQLAGCVTVPSKAGAI